MTMMEYWIHQESRLQVVADELSQETAAGFTSAPWFRSITSSSLLSDEDICAGAVHRVEFY
jgi:hypothetical protein